MTRRSLFGLLPAPLAGFAGGLLTVVPEVSPAPASDPLAEAALAVQRAVRERDHVLDRVGHCFGPAARHPDPDTVRRMELYMGPPVSTAEAALRAALRRSPGLSVVIDGRVYSGDRSRSPVVVEPRWVALLTPATA